MERLRAFAPLVAARVARESDRYFEEMDTTRDYFARLALPFAVLQTDLRAHLLAEPLWTPEAVEAVFHATQLEIRHNQRLLRNLKSK